jgi:hypothetical protein
VRVGRPRGAKYAARATPWYLSAAPVDVLTKPEFQRSLQIGLAVVAALGAAVFLGVLWTARRPIPAQARIRRRRIGAVGLFAMLAAGAAFAALATPVEPEPGARFVATAADVPAPEDVATARRFSSAKMPALSLDAPDGWTLELDEKGRKLAATRKHAHLSISSALLTNAVDVENLLGKLAETQRALGFDVGATFTDRIGALPAAGFLATGPARSVCTWMVKRDTRLATSIICTADGKPTAREACRAVIDRISWRAPGRP